MAEKEAAAGQRAPRRRLRRRRAPRRRRWRRRAPRSRRRGRRAPRRRRRRRRRPRSRRRAVRRRWRWRRRRRRPTTSPRRAPTQQRARVAAGGGRRDRARAARQLELVAELAAARVTLEVVLTELSADVGMGAAATPMARREPPPPPPTTRRRSARAEQAERGGRGARAEEESLTPRRRRRRPRRRLRPDDKPTKTRSAAGQHGCARSDCARRAAPLAPRLGHPPPHSARGETWQVAMLRARASRSRAPRTGSPSASTRSRSMRRSAADARTRARGRERWRRRRGAELTRPGARQLQASMRRHPAPARRLLGAVRRRRCPALRRRHATRVSLACSQRGGCSSVARSGRGATPRRLCAMWPPATRLGDAPAGPSPARSWTVPTARTRRAWPTPPGVVSSASTREARRDGGRAEQRRSGCSRGWPAARPRRSAVTVRAAGTCSSALDGARPRDAGAGAPPP